MPSIMLHLGRLLVRLFFDVFVTAMLNRGTNTVVWYQASLAQLGHSIGLWTEAILSPTSKPDKLDKAPGATPQMPPRR
jgi:hypothetical protein